MYIILVIIILIIFYLTLSNNEHFIDNNIEIVISRYNEDLSWINDDLFNKYAHIIYNKGTNNIFVTNNLTKNIINLKNLGRCDHTYLYHIIQNYDNLANITIFLPGSVNMDYKYTKAKMLINEIEKHNDTVFIGYRYNNAVEELYNFQLNEWSASNKTNLELNNESKLDLARIRPFGLWYKNKFNNLRINYVSYWGILGISKNDILQYPKSYYINLITELETSSNPEVGHYIERSWNAIFNKFKNVKYINYI
jgi:hypothetical protein